MRGSKHRPNDTEKRMVESMAACGIQQSQIALILNICENTLRKHYEYELKTAEAKANAQVAQRLYNKCLKDDTASIIFWLKTRAQWKETQTHEHLLPKMVRITDDIDTDDD